MVPHMKSKSPITIDSDLLPLVTPGEILEEEFLQSYLVLENVTEIFTEDGSASLGYLKNIPGILIVCALISLGLIPRMWRARRRR